MKSRQSRKLLALAAMMCGISGAFTNGGENNDVNYIKNLIEKISINNQPKMLPDKIYYEEDKNRKENSRIIHSLSLKQYLDNVDYIKNLIDKTSINNLPKMLPDKKYYIEGRNKSNDYGKLLRIYPKSEVLRILNKVYTDDDYPRRDLSRRNARAILRDYGIPNTSVFDKNGTPLDIGLCLYRADDNKVKIGVLELIKNKWTCTSYVDYVNAHNNLKSPTVSVFKPTHIDEGKCWSPVLWMLKVGMARGDSGVEHDCIDGVKEYLSLKQLIYCCYEIRTSNGEIKFKFYKPDFENITPTSTKTTILLNRLRGLTITRRNISNLSWEDIYGAAEPTETSILFYPPIEDT